MPLVAIFSHENLILRRFLNTFSNGFAKNETDNIKRFAAEKKIKRRRLEESGH